MNYMNTEMNSHEMKGWRKNNYMTYDKEKLDQLTNFHLFLFLDRCFLNLHTICNWEINNFCSCNFFRLSLIFSENVFFIIYTIYNYTCILILDYYASFSFYARILLKQQQFWNPLKISYKIKVSSFNFYF